MTMTRDEIRRAALAIHEMRNPSSRSAAARRRYDRGFDTGNDYDADRRRAFGATHGTQHGAVDQMFAVHERTGRLPKGSWS